MINLTIDDIDKIRKICGDLDINYFTLEQDATSGIGSVLTLTYASEIKNYPASIRIEVTGVENW
jgi:hypothetical protein